MNDFAKTVSHMVENQFPAIFKEEGPELVAFAKAYYEFLETTDKYSIKMSRQMFDANDIDDSLEEFISHFKRKYLADIPYVSATDKRFMIKHIMDMYRSKGSKRSLELFMRMLFNEEIDVYYPGQDILRASDSDWYRPIYLEVTKTDRTRSFLNKEIKGGASGATAFVEGIVTKRIAGKHIDVLYLSGVRGTFQYNERISDDNNLEGAPVVNGSLSDIQITLGGRDNVVGDIFNVISPNGTQGKIRITSVEQATGRVDFELVDGGYGYTNTNDETATDVYVSDAMIEIVNTDPRYNFIQYENVVQRLETLSTLSSTDINSANVGDFLVGVNGSGSQVANGIIVSVANTDANGTVIFEASANSNIVVQTVGDTSFRDQKLIATTSSAQFAVGELLEEKSKVTLGISSLAGSFVVGQTAQQITYEPVSNNIVGIAFGTIDSANSTELVLDPAWGTFVTSLSVEQESNPAITASVDSATVLPADAGARGLVVSVDGANVAINDLFGEFNATNEIRGKSTKLIDTIASVSTTGASDLWLNGVNTANGVVDLVANSYATGIVVDQNTSFVGIHGNTTPFKEFDGAYIETVRDTLYSIPTFEFEDPTYELPAEDTFSPGIIEFNEFTTDQAMNDMMFSVTASFPDPLINGTIFNIGGEDGCALYVDDSLTVPGTKTLILLPGIGSEGAAPIDRGILAIEQVDLPINLTDDHFIQGHIDPINGTTELWIDGVSKGIANNTTGSSYGTWTGSHIFTNPETSSNSVITPWTGSVGDIEFFYDVPNPLAVPGSQLDINRPIISIKTGESADFKVGFLENTETISINTDIIGANNVAEIPYAQIILTGEGSGIGFIDSITVDVAGTQYANGTNVTFSGGGYANGEPFVEALGTITTDGAGAITSVTMTEPGEGYFINPVPTLPATAGDVASVTPVMDYGYGFPKLPDGDIDTLISDLLTDDTFTIGTIASLTSINPGTNYNVDPFIAVRNKHIASYGRRDIIVEVENISGTFTVGENITQDIGGGSTAKGFVSAYTNNGDGTGSIYINRTSFAIAFTDGIALTGASSGASADVVSVTNNELTKAIGENAVVTGTVIAANGIATGVDVIDSGYGYLPGSMIKLERDGLEFIIEGKADVTKQGISEGYWRTTTSHLNSEKKIQDSKYYQEFSYDVMSGISLNRYKDALKDVLHVSGNEIFGSVVKKSILNSSIDIADSSITTS